MMTNLFNLTKMLYEFNKLKYKIELYKDLMAKSYIDKIMQEFKVL